MTYARDTLPSPFRFRAARILITMFAFLTLSAPPARAASSASLVSIEPSATDVSSQVPPLPGRLAVFAWQGSPGTEYTMTFSVDAEPALVVGVGATIQSTTYDSVEGTLEVVATYDLKMLKDDRIELPDNTFIISLDPGATAAGSVRTSSAARSPRRIARATAAPSRCFGPGSDPDFYDDTRNDFGDDDGLVNPDEDKDLSNGLPPQAAGSFVSVQSFYWCVTAPTSGGYDVGVTMLAGRGSVGGARLFVSGQYLDYLDSLSGKSTNAKKLAIFSEGIQVSIGVVDQNDGALVDASLPFILGSTLVNVTSRSAAAVTAPERAAAGSNSLITRSFSLGEREPVSLVPENLRPAGRDLGFSGFVDDEDLAGEIIEIVRLQRTRCPQPSTQAISTSGIVIGRDTIGADGSYNVRLPTSSIFPNNAGNSKLTSRISGDAIRRSREISLTNRSRSGRQ